MPPKKCKNISGQWTLSGALVNSQEPSSNSLQRKAALNLWQRFSGKKWIEQFPWTELQSDGVYCQHTDSRYMYYQWSQFQW